MKKLGFGLMRLPRIEGGADDQVDVELFKKMADVFMARGFTYYDTAYMYHRGMSERFFKEAVVERYPRESFTITDKLPMMMVQEEGDLERIFNEQLERTGAGYFDYYWLHNLNTRTYEVAERTNAFAFVQKKMEEGLVRHLGFSFHDNAELLDRILTAHPEVEIVQLQINYLDWNDPFVQSGKCYEVAVKHGKLITVMEPVKGGKLAKLPKEAEEKLQALEPGMSPASFAIRFVAGLPNVFMVLSGMSNLEQTEDNTSYMKDFVPLTEEEVEALRECAEIIKRSKAVPCTGCRYCTEGCPMRIPIPEYFILYNNVLENPGEDWILHGNQRNYLRLADTGAGRASECLGCGLCEAACPQHIEIPGLMPKVAEVLEV